MPPERTRQRAESRPQESHAQGSVPPRADDLLAAYIDDIRGIPPFTRAEEIETAQRLESLERQAWRLVLGIPRAVEILCEQLHTLDRPELSSQVTTLYDCYMASRQSRKTAVPQLVDHPAGSASTLVDALRWADCDKEILDRVVKRLRRDVTPPHVTHPGVSFRTDPRDVARLESLRSQARTTRDHFVRGNLRLVISVARKLHTRGIPLVDSIQEGNIGLVKAVHRFDYRRGFRFSTYAHWWIRHCIMRSVVNVGGPVRLPIHVADLRRRVDKAHVQLSQRLGRAPTTGDIATHLDKTPSQVATVMADAPLSTISLNERLGDDDRRSYVDLLANEDPRAAEDRMVGSDLASRVARVMRELSPLEQDVLRRRFGLYGDHDETLDEVSRAHNLSRERVRQVQRHGLGKLRRLCRRRQVEP